MIICPICKADYIHSKSVKPETATTKHMHFVELLCCDKCEFAWASPEPEEKQMKQYYTDMHRSNSGFISKNDKTIKPFRVKFYLRGVSQIELCRMFYDYDEKKDTNLLDVGAGYGYTLDISSSLIPDVKKFCIEPAIQMKERLQKSNIKVYQQMLMGDNADYLQEDFDTIIISHVLEHFSGFQVENVIRTLKSKLKMGGILFCEVPNGKLDDRRDNPGKHQSFFAQKSLRILFESVGLEVSFLNTCGPILNDQKSKTLTKMEMFKKFVQRIPFSSKMYSKLVEITDALFFKKYPSIVKHPYFIYGGGNRQFIRIIGKRIIE